MRKLLGLAVLIGGPSTSGAGATRAASACTSTSTTARGSRSPTTLPDAQPLLALARRAF